MANRPTSHINIRRFLSKRTKYKIKNPHKPRRFLGVRASSPIG